MEKDKINEILNTDFKKLPSANELYKEMMGQSEIERFKLEDYVLDQIIRGKTKTSIIRDISAREPEGKFSMNDLEKFIERNKQVTQSLEKQKTSLARRHLNAKANVEEELAQVAMFTKQLIKKYDGRNDHANTISAIKAFEGLLVRYAKLAGFWNTDMDETPKNIIQIISDKKSDVAQKIVRADFKMVNENEESKEKHKDKERNS